MNARTENPVQKPVSTICTHSKGENSVAGRITRMRAGVGIGQNPLSALQRSVAYSFHVHSFEGHKGVKGQRGGSAPRNVGQTFNTEAEATTHATQLKIKRPDSEFKVIQSKQTKRWFVVEQLPLFPKQTQQELFDSRPFVVGKKELGPFCQNCSHGNLRMMESGQIIKPLHGKVSTYLRNDKIGNYCGRCASELGLRPAIKSNAPKKHRHIDPLRYDPTATLPIRERWTKDLEQRFARLERLIVQAVETNNVLGLQTDVKANSFEHHQGRIGQVGGSRPKNESIDYTQSSTAFTPTFLELLNAKSIEAANHKGRAVDAYAGTVSDVLNPELIKHLPVSVHHLPLLLTTKIQGFGFGVKDAAGNVGLYMNPEQPAADYVKGLIHEIKHAIDHFDGKEVTKTIGLSDTNYKAYRNLPSEKRATAFETSFFKKLNQTQIKSNAPIHTGVKFSEWNFHVHSFEGHKGRVGQVGGSLPRENPQVHSPQFKKWFGKSKVVDKDGKPLVVYHGTTYVFDSFNPNSHFGSKEQAEFRMKQTNGGVLPDSAMIHPVYLSIKNPMRAEDPPRQVKRLSALFPNMTMRDMEKKGLFKKWKTLIAEAKKKGHDGIVYDNGAEGEGECWIAFKPTQIKSAIGNRGSYNPNDPITTNSWHINSFEGHKGRKGQRGGSVARIKHTLTEEKSRYGNDVTYSLVDSKGSVVAHVDGLRYGNKLVVSMVVSHRKETIALSAMRDFVRLLRQKGITEVKGWRTSGMSPKRDVDILINEGIITNAAPSKEAYAFDVSQDKIGKFMAWLDEEAKREILGVVKGPRRKSALGPRWTDKYITSAYKQGIAYAWNAMKDKGAPSLPISKIVPAGKDTVVTMFNAPVHVDRVGLLYARTYEDLKGITAAMSQQIGRSLAEGMAEGRSPFQMARILTNRVQKVGLSRARTMARTETIRAHHVANLTTYQNAGISGVAVVAEFLGTDDEKMCETCAKLEGKRFTIKRAMSLIPMHPNCLIDGQIPVFTSTGWKPIVDVVVGDLVLTHKGRFRKVVQLHRNQIPVGTEVVRFGSDKWSLGNAKKITVTGNHPILTDRGWVNAEDLDRDDIVRLLAQKCANRNCENNTPWARKYCCGSCKSEEIARHQWEKPGHRESMRVKVSEANRRQYANGERDGTACTKAAHAAVKRKIESGQPVGFQVPEVKAAAYTAMMHPDVRKKISDSKKGDKNPTHTHPAECAAGRAVRQKYLEAHPDERLNALLAQRRWAGIKTSLEQIMSDALYNANIPAVYNKQVGRLWVDFAVGRKKVAVECDGDHWHQDKVAQAERDKRLEVVGWTVLHFTETEITKDIEGCVATVQRVLKNHTHEYKFKRVRLTILDKFKIKKTKKTYNLSVEEDESYLAHGWVVHNCRCTMIPVVDEGKGFGKVQDEDGDVEKMDEEDVLSDIADSGVEPMSDDDVLDEMADEDEDTLATNAQLHTHSFEGHKGRKGQRGGSLPRLSSDQKQALLDYTRGVTNGGENILCATDINRALYATKDRDERAWLARSEVKQHLSKLDASFKSREAQLNSPLQVYRGLSDQMANSFRKAKVGDVVHHPAYFSTSHDQSQAVWFAGSETNNKKPVVLRLTTDVGLFLGAFGGANKSEKEVLLPRDMRLRVVGKQQTTLSDKNGKPKQVWLIDVTASQLHRTPKTNERRCGCWSFHRN